jgi:hypothetical protein
VVEVRLKQPGKLHVSTSNQVISGFSAAEGRRGAKVEILGYAPKNRTAMKDKASLQLTAGLVSEVVPNKSTVDLFEKLIEDYNRSGLVKTHTSLIRKVYKAIHNYLKVGLHSQTQTYRIRSTGCRRDTGAMTGAIVQKRGRKQHEYA